MRGEANVIGSGPNALAAAVVLARAGVTVRVYEAASTLGGGARTAELVESGVRHDLCSAVHPGALSSPFFTAFGLAERVEFRVPEISYGQARPGQPALLSWRDLARTVAELGAAGPGWERMFGPLVRRGTELAELSMGSPLRAYRHLPTAIPFGLRALRQWQPAVPLRLLRGPAADLLAGVEAHANHPLSALSAPLVGLALATQAHSVGWPVPVGGSQAIVDALAADLVAHGGTVTIDSAVTDLAELPRADATLFGTSAKALLDLAGPQLPAGYRAAVSRFRPGAGVGKVDFVLSEPVPWADARLGAAATVHIGGSRTAMAVAEAAVRRGRIPANPVVIANEPTRFDPGRAPAGRHVLWAYAHLPAGSDVDPTELITATIEGVAPGFRDTVLGSHALSPVEMERHNPNYLGGDILGGDLSTWQVLARPVPLPDPWRIRGTHCYLASASAAPGPGVHGMAGFHAARSALRHTFGIRSLPDLRPKGWRRS
ncbi:MAG: phytoene desaturase family protein [Propionibacteriaceae bacterium]